MEKTHSKRFVFGAGAGLLIQMAGILLKMNEVSEGDYVFAFGFLVFLFFLLTRK